MAESAGAAGWYRDRSPRGQGPRRVRASLRYTDSEWAAIVVAAAAAGMKPGAWLADVAFQAARDRNGGIRLERGAIDELLTELRQHRRVLTNIGGNLNQIAAVANASGEIEARDAAARVLRLVSRVVFGCDELMSKVRTELL